ncbi:DsbA family protein (plasmid) [Staphylococcus hyicus]|uniref:DsbA family protein n=2 Tax=Staphylococcus hyicus TaxID=1284 RepID=UPI0036D36393
MFTSIICTLALIFIAVSLIFFKKVSFQDVDPIKIKEETKNNPYLGDNKAKNTIIEFMDFKCPYCKKFHEDTFYSINNKFIKKGDVEYRIVNASILGDDSLIASRAAYAVYIHAPNEYWAFHNNLFSLQKGGHEKTFSTSKIDKEIEKLNISSSKIKKIKKEYKTQNSKSWNLAKEDQEMYKKYKNKYVPSVYVNGKFIKDPYSIEEVEKYLNL